MLQLLACNHLPFLLELRSWLTYPEQTQSTTHRALRRVRLHIAFTSSAHHLGYAPEAHQHSTCTGIACSCVTCSQCVNLHACLALRLRES